MYWKHPPAPSDLFSVDTSTIISIADHWEIRMLVETTSQLNKTRSYCDSANTCSMPDMELGSPTFSTENTADLFPIVFHMINIIGFNGMTAVARFAKGIC